MKVWIIAPVAVLVVAAGAVLGVRLLARPDAAAPPAHTAYVVLTSGSGWQLYGWEQNSKLCLEVLPTGADPDHLPSSAAQPVGGGGCAFDDHSPASGFYASAVGPGGSHLSFGPLPAAATQIRVASNEILPSTAFPDGKGLPAGRYWIHVMPADWPTAADGTPLDTPQPLDSRGQPVKFQAF